MFWLRQCLCLRKLGRKKMNERNQKKVEKKQKRELFEEKIVIHLTSLEKMETCIWEIKGNKYPVIFEIKNVKFSRKNWTCEPQIIYSFVVFLSIVLQTQDCNLRGKVIIIEFKKTQLSVRVEVEDNNLLNLFKKNRFSTNLQAIKNVQKQW